MLLLDSVDNTVIVGGLQVESARWPCSMTTIAAPDGARFVVIGGEPIDGYRHMWWNFVSTRKERIEQAKQDWRRAARRNGTDPTACMTPVSQRA